jgi:hypothetical protein
MWKARRYTRINHMESRARRDRIFCVTGGDSAIYLVNA